MNDLNIDRLTVVAICVVFAIGLVILAGMQYFGDDVPDECREALYLADERVQHYDNALDDVLESLLMIASGRSGPDFDRVVQDIEDGIGAGDDIDHETPMEECLD